MNFDLTTILSNLSRSLLPVQSLIAGVGYLLGLLMMITAVEKLKKIGDARARGGSRGQLFVPLAYIVGGASLIFLPTTLKMLSNTAFGSDSILQYTTFNQFDLYGAMRILIKTAGVIWFLRGCVLLVHASEPGVKHGSKGLVFMLAGILAMNFEGTGAMFAYVLNYLAHEL